MRNILFILLLLSPTVLASSPTVLVRALDAYVDEDTQKFLPELLKGSPLENDKAVLAQGSMLEQIQTFYGEPEEWEILGTCQDTSRLRTTYYIVYHDIGPVFGRTLTYTRSPKQEIVISFNFHTEPKEIFPYPHFKVDDCNG